MHHKTNPMTRRASVSVAIACITLASHTAIAQNALGSGRALDANQRAGSRGTNTQANDFYADLALRNAIITGNAPGGQHFRAEVGYRAAGDFLGATAADSLFNFQRDSYFSGLAAHKVRGLAGMQLQMNISISGLNSPNGFLISRPGAGASASIVQGGTAPARIDPFLTLQGSLRSTSAYLIREADRPIVVGSRDYGNGNVMPLVASSLVGVRSLMFNNVALSGPRNLEQAQYQGNTSLTLSDPVAQLRGPNDPALTAARELASGQIHSIDPKRVDSSMVPVSQHEQLLQSLRTATGHLDLQIPGTLNPPDEPLESETTPIDDTSENPTSPMDDLDAALRRLTESLTLDHSDASENLQDPQARSTPSTTEDEPESSFRPLDPTARREGVSQSDQGASDTQDEEGAFDLNLQMLVDAMAQKEFRLRQLTSGEYDPDNIYDTHMRAGELGLRDGRWMDAEERFSTALNLRPGDALAALGRVQAQIGAGLLRSAASNLRDLMRAYPELASVRLDAGLLPPAPRLARITVQLEYQRSRRRVGWIDAAFLSAYVARLLNDRIALVQAFEDLERAERENGVSHDPVYRFLERVWMADVYEAGADSAPADEVDPASGETDDPAR